MTGEIVRVFNRSKSPLTVTFDGRSFILKPGENHIDAALVGHARRQHLIMGTEDPGDPLSFDSLVARPGDEEAPIEQSKKVEALNRKLMVGQASRSAKVVKTGRVSRAMIGASFGDDANFASDAR